MLTPKLPKVCSIANRLRYLQHQVSQSKQYSMVGDAVRCALGNPSLGTHHLQNRLPWTTADLVKANNVEKSLRMVISFGGVNQKNFWSALEERLAPPMKKVSLLLPCVSLTPSANSYALLLQYYKCQVGLKCLASHIRLYHVIVSSASSMSEH